MAKSAFLHAAPQLSTLLNRSVSGQELIRMSFPQDVAAAVLLNVSKAAPLLNDGAYSAA